MFRPECAGAAPVPVPRRQDARCCERHFLYERQVVLRAVVNVGSVIVGVPSAARKINFAPVLMTESCQLPSM